MKRAIISVVWILFAVATMAQSVELKSIKIGKKDWKYYFFSETKSPKGTLIGFYDNNPEAWNAESWCQELSPFAEKNNWQLIVPERNSELSFNQFVEALAKTDTNFKNFTLIGLGSGCSEAAAFLPNVSKALLISPSDCIEIPKTTEPKAIVLVETGNAYASYWADSLRMKGYWLQEERRISSHPFYIDNYYEEYDWMLLKLDSLKDFLSDSLAFEGWKSQAGVLSELAEVYRQGQTVEISLRLAKPEKIQIDVLDLSGNSVWQLKENCGVGEIQFSIPTNDLNWGVYNIEIKGARLIKRAKIMIRG